MVYAQGATLNGLRIATDCTQSLLLLFHANDFIYCDAILPCPLIYGGVGSTVQGDFMFCAKPLTRSGDAGLVALATLSDNASIPHVTTFGR